MSNACRSECVILIAFRRQQWLGDLPRCYVICTLPVLLFFVTHVLLFYFLQLYYCRISTVREERDRCLPRITEKLGLHRLRQFRTYDYVYSMIYALCFAQYAHRIALRLSVLLCFAPGPQQSLSVLLCFAPGPQQSLSVLLCFAPGLQQSLSVLLCFAPGPQQSLLRHLPFIVLCLSNRFVVSSWVSMEIYFLSLLSFSALKSQNRTQKYTYKPAKCKYSNA
jgi:hypothetical protein